MADSKVSNLVSITAASLLSTDLAYIVSNYTGSLVSYKMTTNELAHGLGLLLGINSAANADAISIDSSEKVGIGTAPDTTERLNIAGAIVLGGAASGSPTNGTIDYTGTDIRARISGNWVSLSSTSPSGTTGQLQYNNAGSMAGATNVLIDGGNIRLNTISTPSTPASGGITLFSKLMAGRDMPAFIDPSGEDDVLQPNLARNKAARITPAGNSSTVTQDGVVLTAAGTGTGANVATTNLHTFMRGVEYLVTTPSTSAVSGFRGQLQYLRSSVSGYGGFHFVVRFGPSTGVSVSTTRLFVGMRASASAPADVDPSSLTNLFGVGWDLADANIQIIHNDGSGTATKINTGMARSTVDRTDVYDLSLYAANGSSNVLYEFTNLTTGSVVSGTLTTDLPAASTLLTWYGYFSVGGTSSVIGIALKSLYLETTY